MDGRTTSRTPSCIGSFARSSLKNRNAPEAKEFTSKKKPTSLKRESTQAFQDACEDMGQRVCISPRVFHGVPLFFMNVLQNRTRKNHIIPQRNPTPVPYATNSAYYLGVALLQNVVEGFFGRSSRRRTIILGAAAPYRSARYRRPPPLYPGAPRRRRSRFRQEQGA